MGWQNMVLYIDETAKQPMILFSKMKQLYFIKFQELIPIALSYD